MGRGGLAVLELSQARRHLGSAQLRKWGAGSDRSSKPLWYTGAPALLGSDGGGSHRPGWGRAKQEEGGWCLQGLRRWVACRGDKARNHFSPSLAADTSLLSQACL